MAKLIGISGSLRRGSYNTALLRAAAQAMPAGSELIVKTVHGIPLYDADVEASQGIPPAVATLKDEIAAADGVLLVTPEYNNGIPGVFKNAIDWLSRPPRDVKRVFGDKLCALAGDSWCHAQQARSTTQERSSLSALLIESHMFQTRSIQSPASRFTGEHRAASSWPVNPDLTPPRAGRGPHGRLATGLLWRHFSQRIDPSNIVYNADSATRNRLVWAKRTAVAVTQAGGVVTFPG